MPGPRRLDLADLAATEDLGRRLAPRLGVGDAVLLLGDLGAGKSSLARALIRQLTTPDESVPSPTFTLVQTYAAPDFDIAHFDLYRLDDASEVEALGLWEALETGVALIEWPQRLGSDRPKDGLWVRLTEAGDGRRAEIEGFGRWRGREDEL